MKGLVRVGIAAAIVVGLYSFGAPSALAATVHCGDVITADVKLDSDLTCPVDPDRPGRPDNSALVVGADGVTIDLNGHTITQHGGSGIGDTVIDNSGGYDNLTVEHGNIRFPEFGVYSPAGANTVVTDMSIVAGWGVFGGGPGLTVTRSDIAGGRHPAIQLSGSGPYRIEGNLLGDDDYGSAVVVTAPGGDVAIRRNHLGCVSGRSCLSGIWVTAGPGAVIERNLFDLGPVNGSGIYADGGLVRHNDVQGSEVGIRAVGSTVVDHNIASHNAGDGIRAFDSVTVSHNTANYNGNPLQCVNVFCK